MASTTIRVRTEDKKRLERLARRLGKTSLVETLRMAIEAAEKEADVVRADVLVYLRALGPPEDLGATDASKIDEYLYGGRE